VSPERPLIGMTEAARLAFPDLPERPAARRLYRWAAERVIPETVVLRAGRALYLRRAAFIVWLEHGRANGDGE
jgi:hypothetical protein